MRMLGRIRRAYRLARHVVDELHALVDAAGTEVQDLLRQGIRLTILIGAVAFMLWAIWLFIFAALTRRVGRRSWSAPSNAVSVTVRARRQAWMPSCPPRFERGSRRRRERFARVSFAALAKAPALNAPAGLGHASQEERNCKADPGPLGFESICLAFLAFRQSDRCRRGAEPGSFGRLGQLMKRRHHRTRHRVRTVECAVQGSGDSPLH